MEISVWDTYVERLDGLTMHFDILVSSTMEDKAKIFSYGKQYLDTKSFETGKLTAQECQFCHMQQAPIQIEDDIEENGYFIIEMENCS